MKNYEFFQSCKNLGTELFTRTFSSTVETYNKARNDGHSPRRACVIAAVPLATYSAVAGAPGLAAAEWINDAAAPLGEGDTVGIVTLFVVGTHLLLSKGYERVARMPKRVNFCQKQDTRRYQKKF